MTEIKATTYDDARAFLTALPSGARVAIAYHGDADGTGSAALVTRYLERTGRKVAIASAPNKGEGIRSASYLSQIAATKPDALLILDMEQENGVLLHQPLQKATLEIPTLMIEHTTVPTVPVHSVLLLSGLEETPIPSASLMVWRLLAPLVDLTDVGWYMAVGVIGDLGTDATFPELAPVKKAFGQKNIVETVALLNAAERATAHDTKTALSALLTAKTPSEVANGLIAEYDLLDEYRTEIQAERTRCAKTAPRTAGDWVLLRFASTCQLQETIVLSWVGRLPRNIVIAANDGYTPGYVHFAVRTRRTDENVPELLQFFSDTVNTTESNGLLRQAQAISGVLPTADFDRLLLALGFPAL